MWTAGSYQATAALTCPLQFNTTEAIKVAPSVSLSHEITGWLSPHFYFHVCSCRGRRWTRVQAPSPLPWVLNKQASVSQPTADLLSLMIRLRAAGNKATRKWCVTCHGRLRCPEDKATFGWVSVSAKMGASLHKMLACFAAGSLTTPPPPNKNRRGSRWNVKDHRWAVFLEGCIRTMSVALLKLA